MKNIAKLVIVASLATVSSLQAEDIKPKNSLIGIEGGYNNIDITATNGSYDKKYPLTHVGLKLGAEGESYRAFVSGRFYQGDRFDYMNTLEFSLQYLLNVGSKVNLFLGANVGRINFKMQDRDKVTRELTDTYYGVDLGTNIHLGSSFDLEFGARLNNLDSSHLKNGVTYEFDYLATGYASIIYKYSLD